MVVVTGRGECKRRAAQPAAKVGFPGWFAIRRRRQIDVDSSEEPSELGPITLQKFRSGFEMLREPDVPHVRLRTRCMHEGSARVERVVEGDDDAEAVLLDERLAVVTGR